MSREACGSAKGAGAPGWDPGEQVYWIFRATLSTLYMGFSPRGGYAAPESRTSAFQQPGTLPQVCLSRCACPEQLPQVCVPRYGHEVSSGQIYKGAFRFQSFVYSHTTLNVSHLIRFQSICHLETTDMELKTYTVDQPCPQSSRQRSETKKWGRLWKETKVSWH